MDRRELVVETDARGRQKLPGNPGLRIDQVQPHDRDHVPRDNQRCCDRHQQDDAPAPGARQQKCQPDAKWNLDAQNQCRKQQTAQEAGMEPVRGDDFLVPGGAHPGDFFQREDVEEREIQHGHKRNDGHKGHDGHGGQQQKPGRVAVPLHRLCLDPGSALRSRTVVAGPDCVTVFRRGGNRASLGRPPTRPRKPKSLQAAVILRALMPGGSLAAV